MPVTSNNISTTFKPIKGLLNPPDMQDGKIAQTKVCPQTYKEENRITTLCTLFPVSLLTLYALANTEVAGKPDAYPGKVIEGKI